MILRIGMSGRKIWTLPLVVLSTLFANAQLKWTNVDSLYQPLPSTIHVYFTDQSLDTGVFRAYYLIADLKDKQLEFTTDTTLNRRLTPSKFYERNGNALVVVNCTFFSFETNGSLNVVIKNGKIVSHNIHSLPGKGKDTLKYWHVLRSAIGIDNKRNADVAWIYTDSLRRAAYQAKIPFMTNDSLPFLKFTPVLWNEGKKYRLLSKWKMQTAVGGGPTLLQNGETSITNEQERMFVGKAIHDKHPRTAMGYTKDGKLIILVIEGRNKVAHGATLEQEAQIFKDLGCWEALNLDGGGSSCLLINGKETIKPSDPAGQRPVPAVFIIREK